MVQTGYCDTCGAWGTITTHGSAWRCASGCEDTMHAQADRIRELEAEVERLQRQYDDCCETRNQRTAELDRLKDTLGKIRIKETPAKKELWFGG